MLLPTAPSTTILTANANATLKKEKNILEEYIGKPIEEVPEEYREKIAKLREFGLGQVEKTTYELVIEFLEAHKGKLMQGSFRKNGLEFL